MVFSCHKPALNQAHPKLTSVRKIPFSSILSPQFASICHDQHEETWYWIILTGEVQAIRHKQAWTCQLSPQHPASWGIWLKTSKGWRGREDRNRPGDSFSWIIEIGHSFSMFFWSEVIRIPCHKLPFGDGCFIQPIKNVILGIVYCWVTHSWLVIFTVKPSHLAVVNFDASELAKTTESALCFFLKKILHQDRRMKRIS